jgi:hypothetical protein
MVKTGVEKGMMLKWIIKEYGVRVFTGFACSGYELVACACELSNELSCPIMDGDFSDS